MWLSFGTEDIARELRIIKVGMWLGAEWIGRELHDIKHQLRRIMAAVQINQEDLDAVGDSLTSLVALVREIDTTQLPDADKTRLQTGLTDLTTAINEKLSPSTPVEPPADGDV